MTSPHRQSRSAKLRKGFSLIEIVIVMGIVMLVIGGAAFVVSGPNAEREIREAHNEIEDLALQARAMAYSYQQPFVLEIREGAILMRPLASPEPLVDGTIPEMTDGSSLRSIDSMNWPRVAKIDPKYQIRIRRWGSQNLISVTDDDVHFWIHQPNTPCEPLEIQLITYDGQNSFLRSFHPLTAKAVDLELTIGSK